ncbi:glycine cleavage system protein GcvH [Desulfosporosinus sp. Sb-LF]|uniref:glycine cleavage system protein GcvH n=1 Tax=Desulfosporosinus sp. Sb-LF TaxID=2560027 RepID=UPI00107F7786|nr:glycine cleavage system protein GcvH [Desulfosporosinus sp. Sb-LF]TGE32945.1 glycine cleavage system protein GcvH [Desulfosporosinus sp. Sb-LF]
MSIDKKGLDELTFSDDIQYYKEHTWAKVEGDIIRVGITDFAQSQLGDLIFVELPQAGEAFNKGEVFGQAESAKSVSSLYIPLSGEIKSVNNEVDDSPELVNSNPYDDGWMIMIKPKNLSELSDLLSKDGYISLLKES